MAEVSARPQNDPSQPFAALDLGSNSFHLIVALDHGERLQVVDEHKEMVRLAEGLGNRNELAPGTAKRALACLERFGQRIRHLPPQNVRVVGTNTLRKARNNEAFIARAAAALGHKIEIISGREEARLIYLGVSHCLEDNHDSRLVVDIGGGSTELIVGRQFQPRLMESLYIGCVGMSDAYFADGRVTSARLAGAERTARQELEVVERIFRTDGWDTAIGSSGTILAVHDIIEAELGNKEITPEGIAHVKQRLLDAKHVANLDFEAVNRERAPGFPGGVVILSAVFESLAVDTMTVSHGALREGLLHDLLGRVHDEDIREKTVLHVARRYRTDQSHARRVARTAIYLLAKVGASWNISDPHLTSVLRWSATLHEIGLDIAHDQYHKHGGYLLNNMDLPGFSRSEQRQLSLLVRAHRRKFPIDDFADSKQTARLCALLRIAVMLHRGRTDGQLPPFGITAHSNKIELAFPKSWLRAHPLTELDLDQEANYLKAVPIELAILAR